MRFIHTRTKNLVVLVMLLSMIISIFSPSIKVRADSGGVSTVFQGVDYSPVYDYNYYLGRNPDVRNAYGGDPVKTFYHFINYGMREGRQASPNFSVAAYRARYRDLQSAYGGNLPMYYRHYCIWGRNEGRNGSDLDYGKVFNAKYYADRYADLKAAFGYDETRLLNHFLNYGLREGRTANRAFDINVYKSAYSDLQNAFGENTAAYMEHYIRHGYNENRVANITYYTPVFNARFYADQYSDLKAAFGYNEGKLLAHFVKYGMKEGRQASTGFNLSVYKANYEDLRNAFGTDNAKYYIHFLKYGVKEGRNAVTLIKKNTPSGGGNKPSGNTPSGGSGNKPSGNTPSGGGNSGGNDTPACSHQWVWATKYVLVHKSETYLVSPAWDKPITETHNFCNNCNLDLNETYGSPTTDEASAHRSNCRPGGCGYHTGSVVVGYEHIEAHYETDEWDEYEEVNDYQYCSKCGEKK